MKKFASALLAASMAAPGIFAATAYHNQIGFLTDASKQMAVVDAFGEDVVFKDQDGKEVLKVNAKDTATWAPAGGAASLIDFTELKTAGTYQAYVKDSAVGHPIVISDNAYEEVTKASLKFFYLQRASIEITEEYAGKYARPLGHPDTSIMYHKDLEMPEGATFSAPKGWYDAGDFGKYIVNSGITTYTLLQLYKHNEEYFKTLKLDIPENTNEVPDILDEIRWNLEWMLKMQEPTDGSVYHKLTTLQFAGMVLPHKATKQRYAIGRSVTATWDFVAVMALAADIYAPFDKEFAETCAKAAGKARWWAINNPYAFFSQPSNVGTGTYSDGNAVDEQIWGAAELYRLTGDEEVLKDLEKYKLTSKRRKLQGWQTVYALAAFTIATNPDVFPEEIQDSAKALIFELADDYMGSIENGYGLAITNDDFYWGSNSVVANKAMVLLHAYYIAKEEKYLNAAIGIADYLLGRNPLDLSYLTGYGVNQVMHPHHRISQGDTIDAPVPGMLVGGPNKSGDDIRSCKDYNYVVKDAPAKSYYDNVCSYASNEVAINWNAPLAYVLGSIQAILATGKSYDVKGAPNKQEVDGISVAKPLAQPRADGKRLVFRNGAVQIEKVGRNGEKSYFNLRGKSIR